MKQKGINKRKLIGEIFLSAGVINEDQLTTALEEGRLKSMMLGQVLLSKNLVKEDDLARALSEQLEYPYIALDKISITRPVLALVNENLVKRYKVIPVSINEGCLKVGMTNPQDKFVVYELERLTNHKIQPCVCTASDILATIDKYYGETGTLKNFLSGDIKQANEILKSEKLNYSINDGRKYSEQIITLALEKEVKEIIIDPLKKFLRVRFRIGEAFNEVLTFENNLKNLLISNLKTRADLNLTVKNKSQDGKFFIFHNAEKIEVQISFIPTSLGECIFLNISYRESNYIETLSKLGVELKDEKNIRRLLEKKEGVIFVAAQAKNGKTNTFYSLMKMEASSGLSVFSIEDSVTNDIDGVNQITLDTSKELTSELIVDSLLKHNPDVLFFDISINRKTIDLILRASLTKCLIISTVNVRSTFDIFPLLSLIGIKPYIMSSTVQGIIGQRLYKKICKECREELILENTDPIAIKLQKSGLKTYYQGRGCSKCSNTGYRGTIGVYEVVEIDDTTKDLLTTCKSREVIKNYYEQKGLRTIGQKVVEMVEKGIIDLENLDK